MHPIGSGILTWCAAERQSGRYGAFFLAPTDFSETVVRPVHIDHPALCAFEGLHVRITVAVVESRPSGHGGDQALKVFPGAPPAVGTMIQLGVGRLVLLDHSAFDPDDHPTQIGIGLAPSDGRHLLWLDPEILYLVHDQAVEIFIEPTTDPESPPSPLVALEVEDGVYVNADGQTMQIRGTSLMNSASIMLLPEVAESGGGIMLKPPAPAPGHRLAAIPAGTAPGSLN